jgi:hypothetical protein
VTLSSKATASLSRHLVDPQLLGFLDSLPALDLSFDNLSGLRKRAGQPARR